jgi:thiamine biosynthesis lipoprotein
MLENKWFRAGLIAFVIIVIATVQIRQALQIERFSNITVTAGFNTEFRLIGLTRSKNDFDKKFDLFRATISELNTHFDRYAEYEGVNSIYTVNKMAGIAPVKVDPRVIELLKLSREMYDLSNGIFDVTAGAIFEIWHEYREIAKANGGLGPTPDLVRLQEAAECIGWDLVQIDEVQSTIFLTRSCASLDLGGIAKGYAADMASEAIIEAGLTRALVSAGLSSINLLGLKEENKPWNIGVANGVINVEMPFNVAISTSGIDQQNYIDENGTFYHHLINPKTQLPENHFRNVVVISEDATIGDTLSTILFLKTLEEGQVFLARLQAAYPDQFFGAIWVFDENKRPDSSLLETKEGTQEFVDGFGRVEYLDVWFGMTENLIPYAAGFR